MWPPLNCEVTWFLYGQLSLGLFPFPRLALLHCEYRVLVLKMARISFLLLVEVKNAIIVIS